METREPIPCPRSLRDLWPDPLAREWRERYPQLFDADDLRLTRTQPRLHFWEWFAAIHVFERDGACSLVEKYEYVSRKHAVKTDRVATILSESQRETLRAICRHVQPPDLFVYVPGTRRFWFVEAKGPGDRVSPKQAVSHEAITRELGAPVEVLRFTLTER